MALFTIFYEILFLIIYTIQVITWWMTKVVARIPVGGGTLSLFVDRGGKERGSGVLKWEQEN